MSVWTLVAWVGGICLCIVIVFVTINIIVVVLRGIRKPSPPMPPYNLPPASEFKRWDGNGRG
jgi:hypothetical protein